MILDNLYDDGKFEPMIVVFPNGRAMPNDRAEGDLHAAEKIKAFETFLFDLLQDLIPLLNQATLYGRREIRSVITSTLALALLRRPGLSQAD
ncbi:hypothetical protein [Paenibacillus farraposensis]|uniref:hypothetical protein n=1 Tax=Paenibacillus farraposensis TaxID=2807095 RepID=UPI001E58FFE4|nr:hypothetical protein [Paenibacillus farraposensis]